jgi:AraC-like DNA-binding protein
VTKGTIERAPTAAPFAAKCAIAALRQRNIAAAPLLSRASLTKADFDDPSSRVSAAGLSEFLECAAQATSDTAFGLHLAERADPRDAGLIFYFAFAARNLAEAWRLLMGYSPIVDESIRLKLVRQDDGVVADIGFIGIPRHRARQLLEFWIGLFVKSARDATGRCIRPIRVDCEHGCREDLGEFKRFFGCPVTFGAPLNQLVFACETLDVPLLTADPRLLQMLRPYCDEAVNVRGTTADTIRAAVEYEVQRLLPHGQAKAETVANALGLGVRTMARKLSEEGTTFAETIEQLRHSLGLKYLSQSGYTLAQIAWLLGYESPTSFHRAFKRWTSRSPSAVRKEGQRLARAQTGAPPPWRANSRCLPAHRGSSPAERKLPNALTPLCANMSREDRATQPRARRR